MFAVRAGEHEARTAAGRGSKSSEKVRTRRNAAPRLKAMFEKIRELIEASDDHEHPTLEEVGCIEAWICYQQREELADGRTVCGGCGRVLVEDIHGAWTHPPDRMPPLEEDE